MDNSDMIESVVDRITSTFNRYGFYASHVDVMASSEDSEHTPKLRDDVLSIKDAVASGDTTMAIHVRFEVNQVAWSDDTLRPDKAKLDAEFREIVPDSTDPDVVNARIRDILGE